MVSDNKQFPTVGQIIIRLPLVGVVTNELGHLHKYLFNRLKIKTPPPPLSTFNL